MQILRRAYQRSISLRVYVNGQLKVTAGRLMSDKQILEFLTEKQDWIETAQREHQQIRQQYKPKLFREGESFMYLGFDLPLTKVSRPTQKTAVKFKFSQNTLLCHFNEELLKVFDDNSQSAEYNKALRKCYEKAGRKWLEHRVDFWSQKMQLFSRRLSYRSQKTRWGSCSSQGDISLNWRLVAAPLPVLDYVVIHELSHLQHRDHSASFWRLVSQYDSNYKYHRKWLRQHIWEFDFLAKDSELF